MLLCIPETVAKTVYQLLSGLLQLVCISWLVTRWQSRWWIVRRSRVWMSLARFGGKSKIWSYFVIHTSL